MSPKPVRDEAFRTVNVLRHDGGDGQEVDVVRAECLSVISLPGFEVLGLTKLAVVTLTRVEVLAIRASWAFAEIGTTLLSVTKYNPD